MARRGGGGLGLTIGRWTIASLAFGLTVAFVLYATLPDVRLLASSNPETTAFIEIRAREARAKGETPRRDQRWVPYARISPNLKRAVLVAEDSGFFDHDGIDFEQIRESIEVNLEKFEFSRGASTLTQQLAKNLYLSPSKNPARKFREILLARALEAALSKRRIFEIYLNVIEWGDGVYGAEAAARRYFGVPASALSAEQAALLAGAIVNPRVLTPGAPTRRLIARQRLILRRMGHGAASSAPSGAATPDSTATAPPSGEIGTPVPPPVPTPTPTPVPPSAQTSPPAQPSPSVRPLAEPVSPRAGASTRPIPRPFPAPGTIGRDGRRGSVGADFSRVYLKLDRLRVHLFLNVADIL
jgi:monofunctional biosynthetic peptidoglycan transglycosylase